MTWHDNEQLVPPFLADVDRGAPPGARDVADLTDLVVGRILNAYAGRGPITKAAARQMIRAGMLYGWQFANQTGSIDQEQATQKAAASRRKQASARYEQFRAAWEAALAAGRDVSIAELARELGIPRATAYRAVKG